MKKHPIMWTVIFVSVALNTWLLARIPEASFGAGVYASTGDGKFTAFFRSWKSLNTFYPEREIFGELGISSGQGITTNPDVFVLRFKPGPNDRHEFRDGDTTVKWLDGKHIIEATTPYLLLRLDLDELANHRDSKFNH